VETRHYPRCRRCGYDISGVRIDANCPECGEPILNFYERLPSPDDPPSFLAVTAAFFGVLSIGGAFAGGLPGIALGAIAWALARHIRIDHANMNVWSRSLRTAQMADTLASIGLVLGTLAFAAVFLPWWIASH
jgi:hypothetical protein